MDYSVYCSDTDTDNLSIHNYVFSFGFAYNFMSQFPPTPTPPEDKKTQRNKVLTEFQSTIFLSCVHILISKQGFNCQRLLKQYISVPLARRPLQRPSNRHTGPLLYDRSLV